MATAEKPESVYRAGQRDSAELAVGRAYSGTSVCFKPGVKYIVGNEMFD